MGNGAKEKFAYLQCHFRHNFHYRAYHLPLVLRRNFHAGCDLPSQYFLWLVAAFLFTMFGMCCPGCGHKKNPARWFWAGFVRGLLELEVSKQLREELAYRYCDEAKECTKTSKYAEDDGDRLVSIGWRWGGLWLSAAWWL